MGADRRQLRSALRSAGTADGPRGARERSTLRHEPGSRPHAKELDAAIGAWTATLTVEEACRLLSEANIPSTKIYSVADIAGDPQFQARGIIHKVDAPAYGKVLHPAPLPMLTGGLGAGSIAGPDRT